MSIIKETKETLAALKNVLGENTKDVLRELGREEVAKMVSEIYTNEMYEESDVELEDDDNDGGEAEVGDDGLDGMGDGDETQELGEPEMGDTDGGEGLDGFDEPAIEPDEIDLTGANDEDVVKVFKELSGDDLVEIVGDEIRLNVSEPGEYVIKTGNLQPASAGAVPPVGDDIDLDGEMEPETDDMVDVDDIETQDVDGGEPETDDMVDVDDIEASEETGDEDEDETIDEAIPVGSGQAHRMPYRQDLGQPKGAGADNLKENRRLKGELAEIKAKFKKLYDYAVAQKKTINEHKQSLVEYKQSLGEMKGLLAESSLVITSLNMVTRLFTENATTREEKDSILKRFDNVATIKESKQLYKVISEELKSKPVISESVTGKFDKQLTSGKLDETTIYQDPKSQRMKQLMGL